MKVKPLPKLLMILTVVGAVGYGFNVWFQTRSKVTDVPVTVSQDSVPTVQQSQEPVTPPQPVQPVEQPRDKGLDALLQSGKK